VLAGQCQAIVPAPEEVVVLEVTVGEGVVMVTPVVVVPPPVVVVVGRAAVAVTEASSDLSPEESVAYTLNVYTVPGDMALLQVSDVAVVVPIEHVELHGESDQWYVTVPDPPVLAGQLHDIVVLDVA
jgi:hypothetical protein